MQKFDINSLKDIDIMTLLKLKKPDIVYPTKTTINLAVIEKKEKTPHSKAKKVVFGIVIALIVLKFGAFDQIMRIADAQKKYDTVHKENIEMQTKLKSYDKILGEYRAYTDDWMKSTAGEDEAVVRVDRADVLNLIQKEFTSKGEIKYITINSIINEGASDNTDSKDILTVTMSTGTLKESSDILASVRKNKLVESAEMELASGRNNGGDVEFSMTIILKNK